MENSLAKAGDSSTPAPAPPPVSEVKPKKELGSPEPPWLVFAIFLVLALIFLGLYGWSVSSPSLFLAELLVGTASICVGCLFGFLFGLPRTSISPGKDSSGGNPVSYTPSTNLEQISDWLTKILIGVGLVEIRQLGDLLRSVVEIVVGSLKEPPAGTEIITYTVIITFILLGFIVSFLWTRIDYGLLQAMADKGVHRELKEEIQEARQEIKDVAIDLSRRVKAATQLALEKEPLPEEGAAEELTDPMEVDVPEKTLPQYIQKRIEDFKNVKNAWNTDPAAEFFPNAPSELNGFRLDGKIISESPSYLDIKLAVSRADNRPVEDEVIFLLHPTFGKSIRYEKPRDGVLDLTISSAGWFTVVAIIKGTEPTVLSYSLRNLPNAPQWFQES